LTEPDTVIPPELQARIPTALLRVHVEGDRLAYQLSHGGDEAMSFVVVPASRSSRDRLREESPGNHSITRTCEASVGR
jgi:hypothetical protein